MLSTPEAAGLAVTPVFFRPPAFLLHTSLHRADFRYACSALFGPLKLGFPLKCFQKDDGIMYQKSIQIKSKALCSSWWLYLSKEGQGMADVPESWRGAGLQYVFLSSLRALGLSLAITVCHATERHGHTLSSHASFHLGHDGKRSLNTSKRKHVIPLFSHCAKKAPRPPGELYSPSVDRYAEPSPSFIYLYIRLPVFTPCHLSPVFTTCLYAHWGSLNGFC